MIRRHPSLQLVRDPDLSVVAFRRVGWSAPDYQEWSDRLLDEQRAFVVPSSHAGETVLRLAIISPLTTDGLVQGILDTIE